MSSKVNQYFKNKIKSMKGSISDREREFIKNNVPNNVSNSYFGGSISEKEMELLKNMIPKLKQ